MTTMTMGCCACPSWNIWKSLRKRLILALAGLGVAFFLSLTFSETLWRIVQEPATAALASLGYKDTTLVMTAPMESFTIIWVKLPMLTSLFHCLTVAAVPGLVVRRSRAI